MLSLTDVYKFIDHFEKSGKMVASVSAQTGTGKSTMFPEGFYRRGKTIFVVQPTITASMGLAKYMKTRIPEEAIGTAVEGDIRYRNSKLHMLHSDTTPVVYCTAGHLRNILLKFGESKKPIDFVDYIFLDEAHTGDLQYDMIMYMYEYLSEIARKHNKFLTTDINNISLPKLILITATPGVYPFPKGSIFDKIQYPGKSLPVEIFYHTQDYFPLKGKNYTSLFTDVVNVVIKMHEDDPVHPEETDAWLIFCPGKAEIIGVVEDLKKRTKGTIIIPLYSSMMDESDIEYDMIPPLGVRKIIVSTNVAEASITIEGLSGVFDTLVEKTTMEGRNGGTMLTITNISKSSAQQRKGRSGRTVEGFCYRMCTEPYFEKLDQTRKREIERVAPDGLVLDLLSRNLQIEEIVNDNAIPKKTLRETVNRLETIGLLSPGATSVTVAGDWAKRTTLSPRSAMFYWLWSEYAEFNPYIGAVLTAVLETHNGGFFYIGDEDPPLDKVLKTKFLPIVNEFKVIYGDKTSFKFNVLLILYIITTFKSIEISKGSLKNFCAMNNLNNQKISECFKLIKSLSSKKRIVKIGKFDVEEEVDKATPLLFQCFSDLVFTPPSKKYKMKSEVGAIYPNEGEGRNLIIPMGTFETEFKIFVSLYETIESEPLAKIVPPPMVRYVAEIEVEKEALEED